MSKRLQVLMSEAEMRELKEAARKEQVSVGEWVRRLIRQAFQDKPVRTREEKLRVLERALTYSFPTADIDQMNREIEEGYESGLP